LASGLTTRPKTGLGGFGPGGFPGGNGGGGSGGGGDSFRKPATPDTYRLGMRFALAAITMLFIALTSAYVVRQGLDPEWRMIQRPAVLWVNTIVLLASSLTIEKARRATRSGTRWLVLTLLLGAAFVIGQLIAWRELSAEGVYLSTNPHSSFFYLLTGLHGLHLLGGIAALSYIVWRGSGEDLRARWLGATALYWHFMDGLWIYLFVLLFGWR